MAILIAIPILSLLLVVQTAIISRAPLLQGTADILLLTVIAWALQERVRSAWYWAVLAGLLVSFVSGLPYGLLLAGYLLATGIALALRQRVWQAPILAMFAATFFGTLIVHLISLLVLRISGNPMPILEALNLITLPSLLLNLLLAVPIYAVFSDLAKWVYPEQLEI